ncbi:MAG: response regulator transcription factor [Thermomicrobiales bacterium]
MSRPRILTMAAYPTISYGLRAAVESDPSLSYAGNISEWQALPDRLADESVQVILADIDWDADDLLDIGELAAIPPLLLLAEDVDSGYAALAAGFRGVLLRESAVEEIMAGIAGLLAGLAVTDPRILAPIRDVPASRERDLADVEALSPREIEVLDLIARGYPNKAIALELGISEHTVKFHVGSVLTKLDAASRSEAVAIAIRHGMVAI